MPNLDCSTNIVMESVSIDIDKPQWDQSTFVGRLNYFIRITNPLLSLKSKDDLNYAAELVHNARKGFIPTGVTTQELFAAKILYDSAFHPDTGEKMNLIGRMSFQVPGGMVITAGLLVYYRTFLQVTAAQWVNQSFNALVNYTNRNAKSQITNRQITTAYVGATTGAVAVSVGMNSLVKRAPPIVARWVPFVAVAAANCINIPIMRQRELIEGVAISDKDGNDLGKSRTAAIKGIAQVACSRIFMTIPTLLLLPILMTRLEKKYPILRSNLVSVGVQTLFCGILLSLSVPMGCALFPQRSSIKFNQLEKQVQDEVRNRSKGESLPDRLFFNKGL